MQNRNVVNCPINASLDLHNIYLLIFLNILLTKFYKKITLLMIYYIKFCRIKSFEYILVLVNCGEEPP